MSRESPLSGEWFVLASPRNPHCRLVPKPQAVHPQSESHPRQHGSKTMVPTRFRLGCESDLVPPEEVVVPMAKQNRQTRRLGKWHLGGNIRFSFPLCMSNLNFQILLGSSVTLLAHSQTQFPADKVVPVVTQEPQIHLICQPDEFHCEVCL